MITKLDKALQAIVILVVLGAVILVVLATRRTYPPLSSAEGNRQWVLLRDIHLIFVSYYDGNKKALTMETSEAILNDSGEVMAGLDDDTAEQLKDSVAALKDMGVTIHVSKEVLGKRIDSLPREAILIVVVGRSAIRGVKAHGAFVFDEEVYEGDRQPHMPLRQGG